MTDYTQHCHFCEYSGRSDHLHRHYGIYHTNADLLCAMVTENNAKWRRATGHDSLLVNLRDEGALRDRAYCLKCHTPVKIGMWKKQNAEAHICEHVCKAKQTRNRKKAAEKSVTPRRSQVVDMSETLLALRKKHPAGMAGMLELDDKGNVDVAATLERMASRPATGTVDVWEIAVAKLRGKSYRAVNGAGTVSQIKMTDVVDEVITALYSHDDEDDDDDDDVSHHSAPEAIDYEQVFDGALTKLVERVKRAVK